MIREVASRLCTVNSFSHESNDEQTERNTDDVTHGELQARCAEREKKKTSPWHVGKEKNFPSAHAYPEG